MTHPNYHQWPADVQAHYDKTAESIKKHGHTILGTVDGKGNLKRPFAYSIIKRYWQVVEDNRGKSTNTIPLEMLYILNEESVNSLDDELQALEIKEK